MANFMNVGICFHLATYVTAVDGDKMPKGKILLAPTHTRNAVQMSSGDVNASVTLLTPKCLIEVATRISSAYSSPSSWVIIGFLLTNASQFPVKWVAAEWNWTDLTLGQVASTGETGPTYLTPTMVRGRNGLHKLQPLVLLFYHESSFVNFF